MMLPASAMPVMLSPRFAFDLARRTDSSSGGGVLNITNDNLRISSTVSGTGAMVGAGGCGATIQRNSGRFGFRVMCISPAGQTAFNTYNLNFVQIGVGVGNYLGTDLSLHYCVRWYRQENNINYFKYALGVSSAVTTTFPLAGTPVDVLVDFELGFIWVARNEVVIGGGNPNASTAPLLTFTPNTTLTPAVFGFEQSRVDWGTWELQGLPQSSIFNTFNSWGTT